MRQSVFDYIGSLNTLIAVFIGAILATGGALLSEIIQERINIKRRERDAARFFGDILTSIDQILAFAFRSQAFGNPWGNVSIRLFKTALKEAAIYERNRERLFDIRDLALRARIHTHFLTETFPIEALIENTEEIIKLQTSLENDTRQSKKLILILQTQITELSAAREIGLQTLKTEHARTAAICAELEKIAKVKFNFEADQDTLPLPLPTANDPDLKTGD